MEMRVATVRMRSGRPGAATGDLIVAVVIEGGLTRTLRALGKRWSALAGRRARALGFQGREGERVLVGSGGEQLVLLGAGKDPAAATWSRLGGRARREATEQGARRVTALPGPQGEGPFSLRAFVEGFHLAGYRFVEMKGKSEPVKLPALTVLGETLPSVDETKTLLAEIETVVQAVCAARSLVNRPASVATPTHLADWARTAGKGIRGLTVDVLDARRMRRDGLSGTLAVAQGSAEPPRFIVMRYAPRDARKRVALVGKAITFDSGGLSLKPPKSMETMKYDMAGGAAVLATVAAAARLGLGVAVTGYVPATENLPGPAAQKPGDVIRYLNGTTVEVLNTDAEGRLVLADGLVLASRDKPDAIIDLATLTGAARIALGVRYAAILGNRQETIDALVAAGTRAGEPLWQLPMPAEYRDSLRSSVADVRNIGMGPEGGTITAALFLEHFVDGVPWAHLDIAGPAFAEQDWPDCPRGGSGFGVRLLLSYLRELGAES
jgi:leucyl aminopeptidase